MSTLREKCAALLSANSSNHAIALGLAVGVWVSFFPVYGPLIPACLLLVPIVRRLNKPAVPLGVQFSRLHPVEVFLDYWAGRLVLPGYYPWRAWPTLAEMRAQGFGAACAPPRRRCEGVRTNAAHRAVRMMLLIALCAAHGCVSGPREAMRIDGRFDDWAGVRPACIDPRGDGGRSGVDFGRVWIRDDRDALYFRFDTGKEISLQSRNGIALYLDTDDSAETGIPVGGIGADVSWRFGAREGVNHRFTPARRFNAYEAGLVTGPTVTSREHEIKMRKDAGTRAVRWFLRDEGDGPGDIAPDQGAAGRYECTGAEATRTGARPLAKRSARDVRVVSNNVYEDNIFNREAEFSRILNALAPDVLALQEIRRHRAAQVAEVVTRMTGGTWHMADHVDCFTLSRYPVLSATKVAAGIGALLDLPDETYARDLFLVNLHLGAGTKDERRQREVDEVVAALRDLKAPGRPGSLPPGTPIVLVGDLNLVGLARQLATLLTGDIADEARFGPDSPPDWDGTAMTDLAPSHLSAPEAYTWANYHRRGFGPGRIDYVIYTDSAVAVANRFVLSTDTMSDADLAAGGLRRNDTRTASDHLPIVADLVLP